MGKLKFLFNSSITQFQLRWCSSTSKKQEGSEFELSDAVLDTELAKYPKLAQYGKPRIIELHETFISAGFHAENAFKMIKKCPDLLRHKPKDLEKTLECWRGYQFTNSQFIQLFVQCPELLEFGNENELRSRFADLKTFARNKKNIWRLLMASPDIMTDNPKVIDAKANYLLDEMKVDISDAVKSGVFSHSLEKLKCRHMLLVRLGIYKEKSKSATPLDSNKNPRVHRIVDTSDTEFVRKIAGISLAEFNAFNALYRRELQDQREVADEEDMGSDVDEDGDDDDDDEFDPNEKQEYDPRDIKRYDKNLRKPKPNKTW